jgi:nucleoside-diphosphate-sugar epimerase
MTILVTGAFGNLGTYVLGELLRQGYKVRAFDLPTPQPQKKAARFSGKVDTHWGDLRQPKEIKKAVKDVETVLHLAAVIPPLSDADPELAWAVNAEGTRHLLAACKALKTPPRFFFASTFDLFGHTQKLPPPRKITDPIEITDIYTKSKAAGEKMVKESGLDWLIFRFSDMPVIGLRPGHPVMYRIPLDTRIETMHPADGALAAVNALKVSGLWGKGRTLLVGGGSRCQVTYRQFLFSLLTAMGIGPLPEEAFGQEEYVTDWLDTAESQRLLRYQRHSFEDIVNEVAACLGWRKVFVPLARPFARKNILKLSPHYNK